MLSINGVLERMSQTFIRRTDMGIDTVKIRVPDIKLEIADRSRMQIKTWTGEIVKEITNRKPVKGVFGKHNVQIRSDYLNNEVVIEGALHAFLYGQNVYTSNDLRMTVFNTIKRVRSIMPFEVTDRAKRRWLDGDIEIMGIDVNRNMRFTSNEQVEEILRQIGVQLAYQGTKSYTHGSSVQYSPRDGADYEIGFYNKGIQARLGKIVPDPDLIKLGDEVKGLLRIELCLSHAELKRNGLNMLSDWNTKTADMLFDKYFARLPLLNVTWGPVTNDEIQALPEGLKKAIGMHKAGLELSMFYSKGHIQRIYTQARKLGIDMKCKNQQGEPILLKDLLIDERKAHVPSWILRSKLWSKRSR